MSIAVRRDLRGRHTSLLRFAGVIAILLFGFWAGMSPHWDYVYPLHVDEWFHLGYTQSMLEHGSLRYPDPYGSGMVSYHQEMGFHLILGFVKTVTGLSWMGLYRVADGVIVALLAFFVYALGRREGFGWAAALFVPLIPTSIRTLGPTFLVPVSVAMLFIPLTILVLHRLEAKNLGAALWLLLVLVGGTIFVHPPTEAVVTGLAAFYLAAVAVEALAARRYHMAGRLAVGIAVRLLIPIVILGLWLPSLARTTAERAISGDLGLAQYLGFSTGFVEAFGIIGVALFVFGVAMFMLDSRYGPRAYVMPLFTLSLIFFLVFFYPRYYLGSNYFYERAWLYLGLFMAILAGYGIARYFHTLPAISSRVGSLMPRRFSGWVRGALLSMGMAAVAAALVFGLTSTERRGYAKYYHMVDAQMYADFVWLGRYT
ncbi:MAG: hypothetical protein AAB037_07275, partial [Chloroflexota bacterium]